MTGPLEKNNNTWAFVFSKKFQNDSLMHLDFKKQLQILLARTWKQPRCPSADEWIRKRWYIYTMEYYSAIKNNSFESVLMRWMKLEPIIQSEVSQKEKTPVQHTNSYKWNLERW